MLGKWRYNSKMSALDEAKCSTLHPHRYYSLGKSPWYTFSRGAGSPQFRSGPSESNQTSLAGRWVRIQLVQWPNHPSVLFLFRYPFEWKTAMGFFTYFVPSPCKSCNWGNSAPSQYCYKVIVIPTAIILIHISIINVTIRGNVWPEQQEWNQSKLLHLEQP